MDKIQGKIKFIAPSLQGEHYSTAYILGNITWLMMHSKQHETMPLHMMASQIFPAIAISSMYWECQKKAARCFIWPGPILMMLL
mgnify:CR=1 FL=1